MISPPVIFRRVSFMRASRSHSRPAEAGRSDLFIQLSSVQQSQVKLDETSITKLATIP
jgi:hypothetical protein